MVNTVRLSSNCFILIFVNNLCYLTALSLHNLLVTTTLQQPHVSSTTEQSSSNIFVPRMRPISLHASLADENSCKTEELPQDNGIFDLTDLGD